MVEAEEAVAVAYLESVKLQFDLQALLLVHGSRGSSLQTAAPREIYRFQRRNAYRVRPSGRGDPRAVLRHPSLPDMQLALRVLDVSIGGCALWLPADVPPMQAGTEIHDVALELDGDTRLRAALLLQHVSSASGSTAGVRLGCEWQTLDGAAQRALQRWIDTAQKRRRLLNLSAG
jgi:c-di-GMP-binding flagellar brake protein YcgR